VFISHSEVLVQFDEGEALNLYLHQDLDEALFGTTKAKYEINAKEQGTQLNYKGRFSMDSIDGKDEVNLQFYPVC
jgi:hypothetical protein